MVTTAQALGKLLERLRLDPGRLEEICLSATRVSAVMRDGPTSEAVLYEGADAQGHDLAELAISLVVHGTMIEHGDGFERITYAEPPDPESLRRKAYLLRHSLS